MPTYTQAVFSKNNYLQKNAATTVSTLLRIGDAYVNPTYYVAREALEATVSLPAGAVMTAARLKLYYYDYYALYGNVNPSGVTAWAYKLNPDGDNSNFTEAYACWNNYASGEAWDAAGGDYVTSNPAGGSTTFPASPGAWMTWDITAIVADAIANLSGVVKLLLKFATENVTSNYHNAYFRARADENPPAIEVDYDILTVDTEAASSVAATTAVLNGNVTDAAGGTVDRVGFVWKTGAAGGDPGDVAPETQTEYTAGYKKSDSGDFGEGAFASGTDTSAVTGLSGLTTYHYRACAHTSACGWVYGDDVEFTTLATHRISNAGTGGVKIGGSLVTGAKVLFYDTITGTLSGSEDTVDGMYEHDEYSADNVQPRYVCIFIHDVKASLTTAQGGNKDLVFTAKSTDKDHWYPGQYGNALTIHYHHTGSVSVGIVGSAITVNINEGVTTAAQIKTAIEGDSDASKMVGVAYAQGQNGSGTPAAMDATALAGGAIYTGISHNFITPTEIT